LFKIVERDIKDAKQESLSADWKFGIAYNAALKLCTILLYASGFQAVKNLAHYRTLQSLPLILGKEKEDDAIYLDRCRAKRNIVEYDYAGGTTEADADELIDFVNELKTEVANWIKIEYPELI
jgi:hypothetical protein